jgi:hypothetical protein
LEGVQALWDLALVGKPKVRGQDADDCVSLTIEIYKSPNDVGISAEFATPK